MIGPVDRRYLNGPIAKHLATLRQMVFLVGPRQVGKTTLARSFLSDPVPGYNFFNWDSAEHRKILTSKIFAGKERLDQEDRKIIVFDEIHKYPRWKNALKGLFDLHEPHTHWIVTGSALLNVYRRGQDSLLGRYFTYHLAPFSAGECLRKNLEVPLPQELPDFAYSLPTSEDREAFENLLHYSGFPEPFFRAQEAFLTRWRTGRLDRLINQDLATTENLRNLPLVEQLMFLLPERVGSPLSLNGLREDLEVHFATVRHWMELLERVFYGFFVRPYSKRLTRMLKKEPKWYLWDWTEIEDEGRRFENLVAVHLLKYVNFLNDLGKGEFALHYVRNKEKQEADFLICDRRKPALLMECKWSQERPDPALKHFAKILGLKHAIQITRQASEIRRTEEDGMTITVLPASSFLRELI